MAADMDALKAIAKKKKISIIEDAAHAFGASYKGKMVGGLGTIACFSFDPIKNITCGEGGCITTDDDELAELLRTKRLLGINKDTWTRYKNKRSWSYEVTVEGFRYHMSNISAAIGLAQLPKLAFFLEKKRSVIREYDGFFKSVEGVGILKRDYDAMAPFNYTVKIEKDRDLFIEKMEKAGISVGVNYLPNHTQPFFKRSSVRLPVTEKVCKEIASLPLYYDITDEEITRVEDSVRGFVKA
jgi:perosamine synthetase